MKHITAPHVLLLLALLLPAATAQVPQAIPFSNTGDLLVVDGSGNAVWRLMDLNLDGDWNDAGEVVLYRQFPTTATLTNIAVGPDGVVYVCDTAGDSIWRLQDLNGDGVATAANELSLFFSAAGNASLVTMPSPLGITVSGDGAVWVANSNTSTLGTDTVIRLFDGTPNGNAQDAGEAVEYARFAIGQTAGVSIPSGVVIGSDGAVYVLENGTTGKGIYRIHDDVVPNGVCTDPGEVTPFYIPTPPAPTPVAQFFGMASDRNGNFWIADTQYERILRVKDLTPDLVITNGSAEESTYLQIPVASMMWNVAVSSGGAVYAVEDGGASDRIYRLVDLGPDGDANDPGEMTTVFDDAVASVNLGSIRALAFLKAPFIRTTPNPVPIGTGVTFFGEAAGYDLLDVYASYGPGNFQLPPYGTVGVSVQPWDLVEVIPTFQLPSNGAFSLFAPIANDPAYLNITYWLQAIGGPPGRMQLSNVVVVTFQ